MLENIAFRQLKRSGQNVFKSWEKNETLAPQLHPLPDTPILHTHIYHTYIQPMTSPVVTCDIRGMYTDFNRMCLVHAILECTALKWLNEYCQCQVAVKLACKLFCYVLGILYKQTLEESLCYTNKTLGFLPSM